MLSLNKSQCIKEVYNEILNEMDKENLAENEDIFVVKRKYFTLARNQTIENFAEEWFVDVDRLQSSAVQYNIGMDSIPNIKDIIESKDLESYKKQHIDVKPFQYAQMIKKAWKICLDEYILPYDNELK